MAFLAFSSDGISVWIPTHLICFLFPRGEQAPWELADLPRKPCSRRLSTRRR
ncbi:hypothetical protein Sinac_7209 [Singulisphaera acidiphila DSM 18658]|uniref:Uncharacterized protein n=1 Tax=Singulisphaera acidiphila (strain ATCC BAA-1392 / DSM 18658 / VKM B-2454 / MOB10) TaxID=886293 RepID=L0DPT0_SINAD|nr:hypothetical protein Sinac_7209 [Singulisphaera acidiphila DSM 18658]